MKRHLRALLIAFGFATSGCSLVAGLGDEPSLRPEQSTDGGAGAGGGSNDGGTDGNAQGDGRVADAGEGADATDAPGADRVISEAGTDSSVVVCTPADNSCTDPNTLRSCNPNRMGFTSANCVVGCSTTGTPHCLQLYPAAPVATSDLSVANVTAITFIAGEARINTETGAISGTITRAANLITTNVEVSNGIAFHQMGGVGIFSFGSLTVASGATVKLIGTNAAALVSESNLLVYGTIDVRPMDATGLLCATGAAGAGGGPGGAGGMLGPTPVSGMDGVGAGAGGGGTLSIQGNPGGGGGGGHAATGAMGAPGCHNGAPANGGGHVGAAYSNVAGGSGGGGGGLAYGGGGGGVVRLVAANVITIGDGSAIAGVDAGACGGKGARGAGGGGSGGQIRLEAPFVQMNAMGTLAANGGGGGGNLNGTDINGQPGQLNASISFGAGSTQVSSLGGNGGAGDAPAGTAPATGCGVAEGMGGGGSAGRLQILAKGGAPNIHAQAVLSPSVPTGAATIGSADVH